MPPRDHSSNYKHTATHNYSNQDQQHHQQPQHQQSQRQQHSRSSSRESTKSKSKSKPKTIVYVEISCQTGELDYLRKMLTISHKQKLKIHLLVKFLCLIRESLHQHRWARMNLLFYLFLLQTYKLHVSKHMKLNVSQIGF